MVVTATVRLPRPQITSNLIIEFVLPFLRQLSIFFLLRLHQLFSWDPRLYHPAPRAPTFLSSLFPFALAPGCAYRGELGERFERGYEKLWDATASGSPPTRLPSR